MKLINAYLKLNKLTSDSIFKIEPFCEDEQIINELHEKWRYEYVVKIGNTILIIKE